MKPSQDSAMWMLGCFILTHVTTGGESTFFGWMGAFFAVAFAIESWKERT